MTKNKLEHKFREYLSSLPQTYWYLRIENNPLAHQNKPGDYLVIRGMSYQVQSIISDTSMIIYPEYRGVTASGVVCSKTIDTKYPQSSWNIDKCDGTGASRFNLDLTNLPNSIKKIIFDKYLFLHHDIISLLPNNVEYIQLPTIYNKNCFLSHLLAAATSTLYAVLLILFPFFLFLQ